MKTLTHQRLCELLHYEPETGVFVWKARTSNIKAGAVAGTRTNGYTQISIDGRLYRANRLAVFYVTAEWPTGDVDHKDGATSNNRWANLRDVTHAVNGQNQRRPRSDNSTGFLGVSRQNGASTFRALIKHEGKQIYLGAFKSPEEAHTAYVEAKRRLHEGCTL